MRPLVFINQRSRSSKGKLLRAPSDWPSKLMLANLHRERNQPGDEDTYSDQELADQWMEGGKPGGAPTLLKRGISLRSRR